MYNKWTIMGCNDVLNHSLYFIGRYTTITDMTNPTNGANNGKESNWITNYSIEPITCYCV